VELQQVSVKVFARDPAPGFDQEPVIGIFHRWIRDRTLGDVLLIDVADYRHVPGGPGVMLIAHEAHYALDTRDSRLGLAYAHRRDPIGPAAPKLARAVAAALVACRALEAEPSIALGFDAADLEIHVKSRLVAPNTGDTFAAIRPDLDQLAARLYGGAAVDIEHLAGKRPFGVRIRAHGEHPVAAAIDRLGAG